LDGTERDQLPRPDVEELRVGDARERRARWGEETRLAQTGVAADQKDAAERQRSARNDGIGECRMAAWRSRLEGHNLELDLGAGRRGACRLDHGEPSWERRRWWLIIERAGYLPEGKYGEGGEHEDRDASGERPWVQ
jgi:hypothetical protein